MVNFDWRPVDATRGSFSNKKSPSEKKLENVGGILNKEIEWFVNC